MVLDGDLDLHKKMNIGNHLKLPPQKTKNRRANATYGKQNKGIEKDKSKVSKIEYGKIIERYQ